MKTIYRYELNNPDGYNRIKMPASAKVLSAGVASKSMIGEEKISIWALVDDSDYYEERIFVVAGTGADLDEVMTYNPKFIGTVVMKSNRYAFHVFEVDDKSHI